MKLKNFKNIWLVNIGEPLPLDGNRPHRMCSWKTQLENQGYNVTFFTTDFEHQRKKWVKDKPIGFVLLKSYLSYSSNIGLARLINHFLVSISLLRAFVKQTITADVIIVSYPTIWTSLVSVIYGKLNKIKVIVDIRDKWPDIFVPYPVFKILLFPLFLIKKFIFSNANKLIAISPGYLKWSSPNNKLNDDLILPLVQPLVDRVNRNIVEFNQIKLLFVGSLGTTYDLEALLIIHDKLVERGIPFQIQVCGDGPERTWLEKNIVYRNNIILYGWLNKIELQKKLDNANFGLMFYHANSPQGWPNKLLEYMANGLPVINTLKGESWDLIHDKQLGYNLEMNDIDGLINWLCQLLNDKAFYNRYVNQNYYTHLENFTEEPNRIKLLKLL
jgi:glycosyltransferase involved in cell wall biosynthesis